MLHRVWPAMIGLALHWAPQGCSDTDGNGGGGDLGGAAGATTENGGAGSSHGGHGGMSGAGHGGLGEGGLSASGSSGSSSGSAGAVGASGGGVAGSSMGGASGGGVAGSGGMGGASGGGVAGSGGMGGASGGGGSAGTAGMGGVQQGSFTLSSTQVMLSGICQFDPLPFANITITNTSSIPLTWHGTGGSPPIAFTPPSSTLAPGAAVSVALNATLAPGVFSLNTNASIDADIAPSQNVNVLGHLSGQYHQTLPADVDFGEIPTVASPPVSSPPLGAPNTRFIPASGAVIAEVLQISNPAFATTNISPTFMPGFGTGWELVFTPTTVGPQDATITFWSYMRTVCAPNTFKAHGVGVAP